MADDVAPEPEQPAEPVLNFQSMTASPRGGLDLNMVAANDAARAVLAHIAEAMAVVFETEGATNYIEAGVVRQSDGVEWTMTVAPRHKPTPHDLRQRAEARAEKAEAAMREVAALLEAGTDDTAETFSRVVGGLADVVRRWEA